MDVHYFYIYSNCDYSTKSAAATRMMYYAKALADEENNVYLVSCCSSKLAQDKFVEIEPNIFVLEKKKLTQNYFSTLTFLIDLNNFSKNKSAKNTFILDPYSRFYIQFITVFYMIFIKKNKVYYELNEVVKHTSYFHNPISLKRIKYSLKKILHRPIFTITDTLMAFYEGLICISTNIEDYGKRYNKNTLRIPILTDPDITIKTSGATYTKNNLFNIGFSGSIVPSKENLLEFAEIVKQANENSYKVAFNLCGTISKRDHQLLIEDKNDDNTIKYYGNLNQKEFSTFLYQQDLLVIPRGYTLQNRYGFSTKLSDYLNHKRVILITDVSDNKLYIKDGVNGFVVPPNNKKLMYEKLIYIIENFKEIEESIKANAYKTSKEKFDYRLYKKPLQNFLKST
ncbi:MAG: glycosyltransferase [Flavobacteriaceae bacterium]|nr:glycosyltransferase [Flavobacteriaceae bacterium]